jgi:hypothetical protein
MEGLTITNHTTVKELMDSIKAKVEEAWNLGYAHGYAHGVETTLNAIEGAAHDLAEATK